MIYLDWAASAPIEDDILIKLNQSMINDFANPSAAHKAGKDLLKRTDECRKDLLKSLNSNLNNHVVFTSSATESNNTLIKGLSYTAEDEVLYFSADHPSIVKPIERLAEEMSFKLYDVNFSSDEWENKLTLKTKLVLLTHVHGQNGKILDIKKITQKVKSISPKAIVHVDAVQSFGKINLDFNELGIDSLTLSSHKVSGPKGVGALIFTKNLLISPLLDGGGHENGYRSSTLAAPLIFAFTQVSKLKIAHLDKNLKHAKNLKNIFEEGFQNKTGFEFLFCGDSYSPYISCFVVEGIPSDVIMRHLEMDQIYVASSSACSSKLKTFNPTFEKLGINKKFHKNVLRVSWGSATSVDEINIFIQKLDEIVRMIKGLKG